MTSCQSSRLRVEHPQRVVLDPLAELVAELVARASSEVRAQLLDVAGRLACVAHRVEQQRDRAQARAPGRSRRRARSPRRRGRGRRRRAPRRRPGSAGGSGPSGDARSGSCGAEYQTFHGTVGLVLHEGPRPPRRCPRAAARCGGRPCPRSRTSPCGRRRWTPPPGGTPRGPRTAAAPPRGTRRARSARRTPAPAHGAGRTRAPARRGCPGGSGTARVGCRYGVPGHRTTAAP